MFAFRVQQRIGSHHVIHNAALRDLLRAERLWRTKVVPVIVAQVVVRDDRGGLDAGTYQEVNNHRLHLGLPGLEVVSRDQRLVLDGQVHKAGDKGVLGGAVDEGDSLKNARNGVLSGGSDLRFVPLQ